ncbi:hypothetical protein LZK82_31830 (plasmid) [Rhizobium leguminosarum]|nr:hypothetical protein LZK82_31830 [Rhizobium leguminosarum]UIK14599.1 hypothetical protein LZK80_37520 [Rhizobium leguminosarum]
MSWHLPDILSHLHKDVEQKLTAARQTLGHMGTKGDATEDAWRSLLTTYLPQRYKVAKAHVCDSENRFSDQIDIVVYDRQYSPLIFSIGNEIIVPAESVYAIFEAKQTINVEFVDYASKKVESVRQLFRTSLPIPHLGGEHKRDLPPILGGILTLDSNWTPPLGTSLTERLSGLANDDTRRLDLGCIASHGHFTCSTDGTVTLVEGSKPATAFLFELIVQLQRLATVPMLDLRAYGVWLDRP